MFNTPGTVGSIPQGLLFQRNTSLNILSMVGKIPLFQYPDDKIHVFYEKPVKKLTLIRVPKEPFRVLDKLKNEIQNSILRF